MKKIILVMLSIFFVTLSYAQVSTVRGTVKKEAQKEVTLFTIEDGVALPYAKTKLGDDGFFAFMFEAPYEGFYVIGEEGQFGDKTPIYLKPGDNAELLIENGVVTFTKKNTPENVIMGQWTNLSQVVMNKSVNYMLLNSTYVDFFPELEKLAPVAKEFAASVKTKNKTFNELMKQIVLWDLDYYALNYLRTPRTKQPKENEYSPYYSQIVVRDKFPNDQVLKAMYGAKLLYYYGVYGVTDFKNIKGLLDRFSTNTQKGIYLMENSLSSLKTYGAYTDFVKEYGHCFVTLKQKRRLEEVGKKLFDAKAGMPVVDFTYPDINGKMVSLSDFKGKVVLVDVWATWCGPCKREIPSLIRLEEELHDNQDIVFMGVSVDEEKDKQKWMNMVKEKGLGGVQLCTEGRGSIMKDYKIAGIPRFMIVDKQGNIYMIDAPRPSDPQLKSILLKLSKE